MDAVVATMNKKPPSDLEEFGLVERTRDLATDERRCSCGLYAMGKAISFSIGIEQHNRNFPCINSGVNSVIKRNTEPPLTARQRREARENDPAFRRAKTMSIWNRARCNCGDFIIAEGVENYVSCTPGVNNHRRIHGRSFCHDVKVGGR